MNGITFTLKLGMLDHLIFSKIQFWVKKKRKFLFSVYASRGAKLLTRLRHKFSHLNGQRYRFNDAINSMCAYGTEVEIIEHFLLRCHFYSTLRLEPFQNLGKIDPNFKI